MSGTTRAKRPREADGARVEALLDRVVALDLGRNGAVAMLVEKPAPGHHVPRDRVEVVTARGLAGDHPRKAYYRGVEVSGREVSAVSSDVLRVLGVDPLVVGDNLVTEGIDLAALQPGDLLQGREVVLERSDKPHRPCYLFRERTGPEAYAVARQGYRGALFVVRAGGVLAVGEALEVVPGS